MSFLHNKHTIFLHITIMIFLSLFTACLPKQRVLQSTKYGKSHNTTKGSNTSTDKQANRSHSSEKRPIISASAQDYINQYKSIAIREMNTYGIPASVTLAQGLLESANGNSTLAREANNHFGIKCTSDWKGETFLQDDDRRDDCFRVYASAEESFKDHSEFLLRKRYAALFDLDKDDYVGWARGLKRAGYATNPRYAELLIDLIERYGLEQYDQGENFPEKQHREERVKSELIAETPKKEVQDAQAKPPLEMTIHEVKAGDTLYSISKRYGLTVGELKDLNSLQDDHLVLGQLLLVSK